MLIFTYAFDFIHETFSYHVRRYTLFDMHTE